MIRSLRAICQLVPHRVQPIRSYSFTYVLRKAYTQSSKTTEVSNEPLQFLGSEASSWKAKDTRSGGSDKMLWYQPYVVTGSLAIFMLYFCVFREENDIDQKLEGSLFDHVEGLEEVQLKVSYKYNKEQGLDTTLLEARLKELGIDARQLDIEK